MGIRRKNILSALALSVLAVVFAVSSGFSLPSFTVVVSPDSASTGQMINFSAVVNNTHATETIANISINLDPVNSNGRITNASCPPPQFQTTTITGTNLNVLICSGGTGIAPSALATLRFNFSYAPSSKPLVNPASFNTTAVNASGNYSRYEESILIENKVALSSSATAPLPTRLVAGQTGAYATFIVVNHGDATALSVVPNVSIASPFNGTTYSAPGSASSINGGSYAYFNITSIAIPSNAPSGSLQLSFNATGIDQNSHVLETAYDQSTSTVYRPPTIAVYSITSNVTYLSANPEYAVARISVLLGVNDSAATTSEANLTSATLTLISGSGADESGYYTAPVRRDSVTTIAAGTNATLIFDVRANNPPEGPKYANFSVQFISGIANIGTYSASISNRSVFTVDRTSPIVNVHSVVSPSGGVFLKQGENMTINATVSDALSGISASTCSVSVGGIPAGALNFFSNACQGQVSVPQNASIYGSEIVTVAVPDSVGNSGEGTRSITVYTLIVNTTDSLTGADIRETSDLSNATAVVYNSSGGQSYSCTPLHGTKSHLCGVPLGTVANVSVTSPAYVANNATVESSRVCVGSGTTQSCAYGLPAGGASLISIALVPNTKVTVYDQFRLILSSSNITVRDSSEPAWFKNITDGGVSDHDGTANGSLVFPLDTGKHTAPFSIRFNVDSPINSGYLAYTNSGYTPQTQNQTNITLYPNFTVFVRIFSQAGSPINSTSGSVQFKWGSQSISCRQNPSNYSEYGCPVPTVSELPELALGGNVTISKPGYVSKNVTGVVPPASTASSQIAVSETLEFNLAVRVKDELDLANLTTSEVSRVRLISSNCTYLSGFWGCPAVTGDETGISVIPLPGSGYLSTSSQIVPFVDYVQSWVTIRLPYTVKIIAKDELGSYLNFTNISGVSFVPGISCSRAENTSVWGCLVSEGTANSSAYVNATTQSGRLNYVIPNVSVPANLSASQTVFSSANNFTVKVRALSEMGYDLQLSGLYVRWGGENPCIQSGSHWYCPANASSTTNISSGSEGFLNYVNSSVPVGALTGNHTLVNTSNLYSVLINTRDEFGTPRNFSAGTVSFGALACITSAARTYEFGCPASSGSTGTVFSASPGFVNYTSQATYSSPLPNASQLVLNTSNLFTLKATVYDELGVNFTSGSLSANGTNCNQFPGTPDNAYYCAARPPETNLSVSRAGFVTRVIQVIGLSDASQKGVIIGPLDGPKYSAVLTVRRTPSSGDESAMSGSIFLNSTTRAQVFPANYTQNKFYFTLPIGNQSLIVNKSGYIEGIYNFTTSASAQHIGEPILDYALRVDLQSETGEGVRGANLSTNNSLSGFVESNLLSSYYLPLDNGAYTVSASKAGFVTSGATNFAVNTTYPSAQTIVPISLLYTLKVISQDWGGAPLAGTTVLATGQTPFANSNTSSTAYFAVDPLYYPQANVSVSKSGYNTANFTGIAISPATQAVRTSNHSQQVLALASDWSGAALEGAVVRLYSGSNEVADCTTTASGQCLFLSYNGASGGSGPFFNYTEISQGNNISFSVEKSGYYKSYSAQATYYFQNSSAPLSLGSVRVAFPIKVRVLKAWNQTLPVEGATVTISNSTNQVASNSTDSDGYAVFLPNYSAGPSESDFFLSGSELLSGALFGSLASKAGYASANSTGYFDANLGTNVTLVLSDNVAPAVFAIFSGRNGEDYVGFENFNLSIHSDETYPSDSSGVNYSASYYRVDFENGTLARPASYLTNCSGYWCNLTDINGWDLPIGRLYVTANITDGQGNYNSTNVSFVSAPGLNETFATMEKSQAASSGGDYFLVKWGLVVKGTQAKLRASNLAPVNCTDCPTFPISGWASLLYKDVAGCYGIDKSAVVKNTWPAGQTPATFCDYDSSTSYAREQNVTLRINVPTGLANAFYNATYGWTALDINLPRANVSVESVSSWNSSPETGSNFTVTLRVRADPLSGSADNILVSLSAANGSIVYPASQAISQIYSGDSGEANFTVTASTTQIGPETLAGAIVSAVDANTGLPATVSAPVSSETSVTIVDTILPLIALGTNPLNYLNSSSACVSFNVWASDNFRLENLRVFLNLTGAWASGISNSSPLNNSYWNSSSLCISDGHFVWGAFANDTSGNYNWTINRTLTIDTLAPTSSVSSPANTTNTTDTTPTVSGTASDATSGVRRVWVNVDAGSWSLATGTTTWSYTSSALGQGTHVFNSMAEDWAGSNQSSYGEVYVTVDSVAPLFSSVGENVTEINASLGEVANLYAIWADATIGLDSAILSTNETGSYVNGTPITLSGPLSWSNFTWTNTTALPDGTAVGWLIWANDTLGNWNSTGTVTIAVRT